ncbi:hypothetical protein VTO42DRAFT_4283 [Malbranchea cinnamomea]
MCCLHSHIRHQLLSLSIRITCCPLYLLGAPVQRICHDICHDKTSLSQVPIRLITSLRGTVQNNLKYRQDLRHLSRLEPGLFRPKSQHSRHSARDCLGDFEPFPLSPQKNPTAPSSVVQ